MSDKFNKTGLSSGSSWSLLTENTAFEEPDSILEKEEQCSSSTRLHVQDASKFGLCPARECLQLAVCKHCQKLVLLSSIQRHYELKHQKFLSTVKPSLPRRCIPSAGHNIIPKSPPIMHSKPSTLLNTSSGKSFIRIEEVNPNELNVKIEEVPLTIPQFNTVNKGKLSRINIKKLTNDSIKKHNNNNSNNNSNNSNKNNNNNNSINSSNIHNNNNNSSSNTSCSNFNNSEDIGTNCTEAITSPVNSPQVCIQVKGNFKKIPHLKVKEYDVDKHCGVWIPEMEQNCTRSFTCKTHPLSLRRQVPGRSKDFDVLLAEHRAKVALKVQENSSNVTSSSPQTSSVSNTNSPFGFDRIVFPTVRVPSSTTPKDTAGSSIKSVIGSPPVSKSISEEAAQPNCEYSSQVFVDYILDEIIGSSNLPSTSVFPKPISTNTFGRRQTDCKCHVYSRRMDHFRNATSSMLDRFNSSSTFASLNPTDPTKVGKDGLRLAVQDPLQNGILYKQKTKTAKISGTKRHLSATENQGIIADSINYVANSKRRHSSEVAVVDPFSITNPPSICRSVSYPAHSGQQLVKVKEFQRTNENNLICHRPKLNDSLTNSVAVSSSEYLIISTSAKVEKLSSTTGTPNLTLNSNLNLCHSLGITKTDSAVNLRQGSFDQTFSSLSKISAAPNITITQGMIVSLPPAVLQNNQQNIYSIGNQIKDLITNSSPTRTVQQVSTTPPALKQALVDGNMSSFQNGINPPGDKNYSYGTSDKQELAPNITVTASSALSGVLQGHVVSATLSMPKSNFKRLNSAHSDQTGLLQQIVVQQSNPSSRDLSAYKTTRSPTTTQTLLSPSVTSSISNSTVTSRQSFLNSPSNANSNNSQPIKHLQKMQLHQLQQQQLQNQQFIVHHGYQQQILPKLPTVPNSMTQFNASQFSTSGSQGSLQFLTQGTNSNSLQQQHGGALS